MEAAPNISIDFILQLKQQILKSRFIVAKIANAESLKLYYTIGKQLEIQAKNEDWGSKVLETISQKLQQELPGLRGFSGSNLKKMRLFYNAWSSSSLISSSVTNQLENTSTQNSSLSTNQIQNDDEMTNFFISVSFTHHFEIISTVKNEKERWYYIKNTALNFWTVSHLRTELKNQSHLQELKFPNNFENKLTKYVAYKDSVVEWLGKITEHSQTKRIRHLFKDISQELSMCINFSFKTKYLWN